MKHFDYLKKCLIESPSPDNIVTIYCCNLSYLNKHSNFKKNRKKIYKNTKHGVFIFLKELSVLKIGTISIFELLFDDIAKMSEIKISNFYLNFNQKDTSIVQFDDLAEQKNNSTILFVTPHIIPSYIYEIFEQYFIGQNYGCFEYIQVDEKIKFEDKNGEKINFTGIFYHRYSSKKPIRLYGPIPEVDEQVGDQKCLLICGNDLLDLLNPNFIPNFHPHVAHRELCKNVFGNTVVLLYPNKVSHNVFIAALGFIGHVSVNQNDNCLIFQSLNDE